MLPPQTHRTDHQHACSSVVTLAYAYKITRWFEWDKINSEYDNSTMTWQGRGAHCMSLAVCVSVHLMKSSLSSRHMQTSLLMFKCCLEGKQTSSISSISRYIFCVCVCVNPTNHCLPLISLRIQDAAACQRDCFLSVFHLNPWLSVTFYFYTFLICQLCFCSPINVSSSLIKAHFPHYNNNFLATLGIPYFSSALFFPLHLSFSASVHSFYNEAKNKYCFNSID